MINTGGNAGLWRFANGGTFQGAAVIMLQEIACDKGKWASFAGKMRSNSPQKRRDKDASVVE